MFKAWLRELPDEILPKTTQARIADQCMGATEVPQMLKDELSKLPPFNYYLLFAITCHLSLLHSYVDKNKMDYRNLCICFQPCLKIDGFCFQFLVCDWKHCWQGCWTEKEALLDEYRVLDGLPPSSAGGSVEMAADAVDDGAARSLSGSSPALSDGRGSTEPIPDPARSVKAGSHGGASNGGASDGGSASHTEPKSQQLPPLTPMMPLSPLGI